MTLAVDIRVLGDRQLERMLKRLEHKTQKKLVRPAIRKSAKRSHDRIIENVSGAKVNVRDGDLLRGWKAAKIRSASKSRRYVRIGPTTPDRADFGIAPYPQDKHFWPYAVEYGHARAPAHPYLRPSIDEHKSSEYTRIARDIRQALFKEARTRK